MGQPERIPLYETIEIVPDEVASPLPRPRRRRRPHRVRTIVLVGVAATVYLSAFVRGARIDLECRQAREACTRAEAEIGELVIRDSVFADPGRVQRIALLQGLQAPSGTDKVAVDRDLLPRALMADTDAPPAPPPQLTAWAGLGAPDR